MSLILVSVLPEKVGEKVGHPDLWHDILRSMAGSICMSGLVRDVGVLSFFQVIPREGLGPSSSFAKSTKAQNLSHQGRPEGSCHAIEHGVD